MVSLDFFHWHNPSGRTMAVGSIQPVTEMSTRNISWGGKSGRCVGLTTLPPSRAECLQIWQLHPPGTLRVCPGSVQGLLYLHLYLCVLRVLNGFSKSLCLNYTTREVTTFLCHLLKTGNKGQGKHSSYWSLPTVCIVNNESILNPAYSVYRKQSVHTDPCLQCVS